jgi:hypothetical protein
VTSHVPPFAVQIKIFLDYIYLQCITLFEMLSGEGMADGIAITNPSQGLSRKTGFRLPDTGMTA